MKAKLRNFTPLPDVIVQKHGLVIASVWGRVWRYAQGGRSVCQASTSTLASDLNLGRRTVMRALKALVADDMLIDTTPDLKNKPHTYAIPQRFTLEISIFGVPESHSDEKDGVPESHSDEKDGVPESHTGVSESHSGVPESHSGCVRESHEDTVKIESKKQVKIQDSPPTPKQPSLQREMVGAIAQVCIMDLKIRRNAGRIARIAKELLKAGYIPEQIVKHYSPGGWWYLNDWRGKKNQPPTPEQLIDTIQKATKGLATTPNGAYHNPFRDMMEKENPNG
jgi:hypothetical protein